MRYGSAAVPFYGYRIVNIYPHDPQAYTQGLAYAGGYLYESTGRYGESSLRRVELASGKVLQIHRLPAQYWGEGMAVYQDKIIQLTWRSNKGFIYDLATFNLLREFGYPTEGWGIAYTGGQFILSDGSAQLYHLDSETLSIVNQVTAHDKDGQVGHLNELEYINGELLANIWGSDLIAIIDPWDGSVGGWLDLSGLLATQGFRGTVDILNGIAYDPSTDRLFVTGKLWPYLFEIELVPQSNKPQASPTP